MPDREAAVAEAVALVESGMSANAAAKQVAPKYDRAPRTIRDWAHKAGVPLGDVAHASAKNARTVAEAEYEADRAQTRVKFLRVVNASLDDAADAKPRDRRDLMMTAAIGIDKVRLEEGKATGRVESVELAAAESRVDEEIRRLSEIHDDVHS